ncbi:MAG: hypothetical protein ABW134_11780 [Candidatus Thiodiazotropha endolucinida]
MAIDKLSLYNTALLLLGQEGIDTLTADRSARRHLDRAYDLDAVKYCLQIVKPRFATKTVRLTVNSTTTQHSLSQVFNLPSDFIDFVGVYTDSDLDQELSRYIHEGNSVYCAYSTIYLRYVSSSYQEVHTRWTGAFANVVSSYLARQVAIKVDATKFDELDKWFVDRVEIAKTLDLETEPTARASASTVTLSNDWRAIYNDALLIMGLDEITSNTDDSNRRTKLDRALDANLVLDLLEDVGWTFAQKSTKIQYDPSLEPAWGYRRVHQKPNDLARIVGVFYDEYFHDGLKLYVDENNHFYCDQDEIYLQYVSRNWLTSPSQWPAFFRRLVAARMAKDTAKSLMSEGADYDSAKEEYEERRDSALSNDAMSAPPRILASGSWVRARTRGGYRNRPGDC